MEELVEKFIDWWKRPRSEVSKTLFHDEVFIQDCAIGNAKEIWLKQTAEFGSSDFKLIKAFSTNSEASVIFQQTDDITNLYYRFSIYLQATEGKIIEVVSTKESVAKESGL